MAKMLEDAFRAIGILEEDDPAHVGRSIIEVIAIPREKRPKAPHGPWTPGIAKSEDYIEITIQPYVNTYDPAA